MRCCYGQVSYDRLVFVGEARRAARLRDRYEADYAAIISVTRNIRIKIMITTELLDKI